MGCLPWVMVHLSVTDTNVRLSMCSRQPVDTNSGSMKEVRQLDLIALFTKVTYSNQITAAFEHNLVCNDVTSMLQLQPLSSMCWCSFWTDPTVIDSEDNTVFAANFVQTTVESANVGAAVTKGYTVSCCCACLCVECTLLYHISLKAVI